MGLFIAKWAVMADCNCDVYSGCLFLNSSIKLGKHLEEGTYEHISGPEKKYWRTPALQQHSILTLLPSSNLTVAPHFYGR